MIETLVRLVRASPLVLLSAAFPASLFADQAYAQIQFIVGTGGDDLRGDSSATATLQSPNGNTLQALTLKGQNQSGWDGDTSHTVTLQLVPPQTACMLRHIQITLTSHNGFGETNDNWDLKAITVVLSNGAGGVIVATGTGNPLARLTGDLPSVVLDGPNCIANVLGPQPAGPLRGFVDLHTHPLANLGFGGKLFYGGPDAGSLLPADPDCNRDVRAANMQQALGHDGSTHGSFGVGGPFSSGGLGVQNSCGDALREQVIHGVQKGTSGAADESSDAHGAPDFPEWPVWADITHQKMWVDWIQRAYAGGLRVLVALAVNNKTLGDMTAGPGDFPTDDKASADLQIGEIKAFVARHPDFMEMAYSPTDLERIVRANRLAVVAGIEVDNIGNLQTVNPLTSQAIVAEIQRLYNEGVRYIFPVHVLDNSFGGTAAYEDLFNYSNYREAGHWWDLECLYPSVNYRFQAQGFDLFILAGEAAKIGLDFSLRHPPAYPSCGQSNSRGLTAEGTIALEEMMRLGMLIDIDHMSEKTQVSAIALAKTVSNGMTLFGYPLNSGHSGLRGYFPSGVSRKPSDATERSMDTSLYAAIAALHGMAGVGSANLTSYQWLEMYGQVVRVMGGAVAGFGTDTDGLAMGMPPRPGSAVPYDDNFPRSAAGTKWFNYNTDGVAHYGMLNDFVRDARTLPGGVELIDNTLMSGANYFLETWQRCETLRAFVGQTAIDRFKAKPLPEPAKTPLKLEKLEPH